MDENCIGSLSSVPCLSARDRAQLLALPTLALLISFLGLLALAGALMALPWGFDAILKTLPHLFTLLAQTSSRGQDLFVLYWAAISGVLFVCGVGRHAWMNRARLAALIAGAISPRVVLGFAQLEGHFWPSFRETSGALDRPLTTLPLLMCALLMPWLIGRAARADTQARTAAQ